MVEFYPILSSGSDVAHAFARLPHLLCHDRVTALRLCVTSWPSSQNLENLGNLCQNHGVALVLAPEQSLTFDEKNNQGLTPVPPSLWRFVDGIHLPYNGDLSRNLGSIRKRKPDIQIGCSVADLDDAMHAGESGADYIALPATATDALAQWHIMAELPTVAELPASMSTDNSLTMADLKGVLSKAAQAGADFLSFPLQLTEQDTGLLDV